MKITLHIPVKLYDQVAGAMLDAEESGEVLTPEDYAYECLLAGVRRDQKARQRRIGKQRPMHELVMA